MPKTQFYTATTIDGFIADSNNSLDWLFEPKGDDDGSAHRERFAAFFAQVGAMCMGSTTYEWVLEHEQLLTNPSKWHDYYGDTPSWVFTHRELPPIPGVNLTFVSGDVAPVHKAMSEAAGGRNIWVVGGGELAGAFADQGLLDELILGMVPVTLGAGAPLMPRRLTSSRLTLTEVAHAGQFLGLTYEIAPPR